MAKKQQKEIKQSEIILPVTIKRLNNSLGSKGPHALYRGKKMMDVRPTREEAFFKALQENRKLGFFTVEEIFD